MEALAAFSNHFINITLFIGITLIFDELDEFYKVLFKKEKKNER